MRGLVHQSTKPLDPPLMPTLFFYNLYMCPTILDEVGPWCWNGFNGLLQSYLMGIVLVDGNCRVEIYIHLLDLTRNSCEK
jgi:hypothetical protein